MVMIGQGEPSQSSMIGQATSHLVISALAARARPYTCMNTYAISTLLVATAFAVSDPAAKLDSKKEMKRFLKDKLTSLKAEEIAALGSENKEICALIQDKEKYVEEKKDSFMRRLRTNLNADCAMAIAKNNPDVFDAMFDDVTTQGRRNFFHRLGAVTVCNGKDAFSKVDSKIKKALDEFCLEDESKKALEDEKKTQQAKSEPADNSSANNFAVHTSAVLVLIAIIGIIV